MKPSLFVPIFGFVLGISASTCDASADQIYPAVNFSSWSTDETAGQPFTLGYEFSLSRAVVVNAIGVWYQAFEPAPFTYQAGLWDGNGDLLFETDVSPSGPVINHFVWQYVGPITLNPGVYRIAEQTTGLDWFSTFPDDLLGPTVIDGFTWLADEQEWGVGLTYPTTTTDGIYGWGGISAVNFSVVPEPSTWAMIVLGFVGLGVTGAGRSRPLTKSSSRRGPATLGT